MDEQIGSWIGGIFRVIACCIFCLPLLAGCNSSPGTANLRFRSVGSNSLFAEHFGHAYFSQSDDGDRTVVLIDDGLPHSPASDAPLRPLRTVPLRQVMRFKILWNPLHGTRIDAPSTTNCVIDWLIRDAGPNPGPNSLRYQGAGFVSTGRKGDGLVVHVRSATLDAASRSGNLTDPLGQCLVDGTFTAERDDQLVGATVAQMDALPMSTEAPPP